MFEFFGMYNQQNSFEKKKKKSVVNILINLGIIWIVLGK